MNSKKTLEYLLYLILITLSASYLYTFFTYSLAVEGEWKLGRNHYGSLQEENFFYSRQVLAGSKLNISLQGGFQEIYIGKKFPTSELYRLSFEQKTPANFYSFVFFRFDKYRVGFRLSALKGHPSAFLIVDEKGLFIEKKVLAFDALPSTVRIVFDPQKRTLLWLGKQESSFHIPFSLPPLFEVGFKGGKGAISTEQGLFSHEKSVLIDDVKLEKKSGVLFSDSFTLFPRWTTLIVSLLASSLFLWGMSLLKEGREWVRVMIILGIVSGVLWNFFLSHRYFSFYQDNFTQQYQKVVMSKHKILLKKYIQHPSLAKKRIVVFGGSTTFGQGVLHPDETWVNVVRRQLQLKRGKRSIDLINWGISASNSIHILHYLDSVLITVMPTQLVFLLGINDMDCYDCLRQNLETIYKKTEPLNIPMTFMADSYADILYSDKELPYFQILRDFANKHERVNFIETFLQLRKSVRQDRGILWSDDVHMTTFGQDEFAKIVTSSLHF